MAGETLRRSSEPPAAPPAPSKGEERISLFWRVFGGTLLSIAALVVMTVYQQFASALNDLRGQIAHLNEVNGGMAKKEDVNDLRGQIAHLNESHAELAKKDDLNARATSLWGALKDVTGDASSLKTRTALLETQLKGAEDERKDLQKEVQGLRERLRVLEGRAPAKAPPEGKDSGD
jgi:predicted  nucleic acid-binding Zn-ribbon protein